MFYMLGITMPMTRMADSIGKSVASLSTAFDELSTLQGEALTDNLESGHDKLKKKFAEITKLDITLNNFLVRARPKFLEGWCEMSILLRIKSSPYVNRISQKPHAENLQRLFLWRVLHHAV